MSDFDFSQLERFKNAMQRLGQSEGYVKTCVSAMDMISQRALKHISNVTKAGRYKNGKTGGTLKKSWQVKQATASGDTFSGAIYTPLEYAPYVEYGHRTRLGRGSSPKYKPKKNGKAWVEGKKYLDTIMPRVEKEAPALLQQKMAEKLREVLK